MQFDVKKFACRNPKWRQDEVVHLKLDPAPWWYCIQPDKTTAHPNYFQLMGQSIKRHRLKERKEEKEGGTEELIPSFAAGSLLSLISLAFWHLSDHLKLFTLKGGILCFCPSYFGRACQQICLFLIIYDWAESDLLSERVKLQRANFLYNSYEDSVTNIYGPGTLSH